MKTLRAQDHSWEKILANFPQHLRHAVRGCWRAAKSTVKAIAIGIKHGVGGLHFPSKQQQSSTHFPDLRPVPLDKHAHFE